jgi:hypothetical protein
MMLEFYAFFFGCTCFRDFLFFLLKCDFLINGCINSRLVIKCVVELSLLIRILTFKVPRTIPFFSPHYSLASFDELVVNVGELNGNNSLTI